MSSQKSNQELEEQLDGSTAEREAAVGEVEMRAAMHEGQCKQLQSSLENVLAEKAELENQLQVIIFTMHLAN